MIYVPVKRQTIKSILEKSRLDGLFLCKSCQDGLPCTIMPLSTFKPFIKKKKKKVVFKVAVPHSLSILFVVRNIHCTLTAKVLQCPGVIFEMQLFNVPSVIQIPLIVKTLRDLSPSAQAKGECLYGWCYMFRGYQGSTYSLQYLTALFKVLLKKNNNKHFPFCPLYAMNDEHQSCLCSGKHFSQGSNRSH